MLYRLDKVIDPGTICRAFEREHGELTWDDLGLVAAVQDLYRSVNEQDGDNGEGR